MRTLMLIALISLTSCGKYALEKDLDNANARTDELETRLAYLEARASTNVESIDNLNTSLEVVNSDLSALSEQLEQSDAAQAEALTEAISEAQSHSNSLLAMIESLQEQTTELLAKQAVFELEDRIVSIIDPCPSVSSTDYKESLFQFSSGKVVAFFEDGGKRFLTVLKTGTTYKTTDRRNCVFTL